MRCVVLRYTLQVPLLRWVFVQGHRRHAVLFLFALVVHSLAAAVAAPLLLMLGPLLFGVPHLLAGYRFLPSALGEEQEGWRQRFSHLQRLFLLTTAAIGFAWYCHAFAPSWGAAAVFLGFFLCASKGGRAEKGQRIAMVGIVMLLLAGLAWAPYATFSSLLFGHNAVAFFYWHRLSTRQTERWVSIGALIAAIAFSIAIAAGCFDGIYIVPSFPSALVPYAAFELPVAFKEWGLAPGPTLLQRMMVIAALGQALHYLLWLKIIPEAASECAVPLPFGRAWTRMRKEVGLPLLGGAACSWIALCVVGIFLPAQASALYVGLAAAHGFAELGIIAAAPYRSPGKTDLAC